MEVAKALAIQEYENFNQNRLEEEAKLGSLQNDEVLRKITKQVKQGRKINVLVVKE